MTTKRMLMKLPIYALVIWTTYGTYRNFRKQTEWNATKKWNLAGCVLFGLGFVLLCYEDFLME